MKCLWSNSALPLGSSKLVLVGSILAGMAFAQAVPAQNVVSSSAAISSAPIVTLNEPADSVTETADTALDPASLLPDLPALPRDKASLVGGTIQKLDRVRDQFTVQLFGGGRMKISFDPRTRIYSDGNQASTADLHLGGRVYVDTILNENNVFARSIRLKTSAPSGVSQGSVISYRADGGELVVRDALSPDPLKLRLTSQTRVLNGTQSISASELVPGTLVALKFGSQQNGHDVAGEVSILARPGASFTFAGHITSLDLRVRLLVMTSDTDGKTYDIYLDPATVSVDEKLRLGVDVTAETHFDGSRYVAQSLVINAQ
jgi:hypothetical protein